jgi:hypothetical protein
MTAPMPAEVVQISDIRELAKTIARELLADGKAGKLAKKRAKLYRRGRGYKTAAYERKNWSIGNLALTLYVTSAATYLPSGWAVDQPLRGRGDPHHHVLYVELPTGQVSFHTGGRGPGPDYTGQWDGERGIASERICRWVAMVMARQRLGDSNAALSALG